MALKTEFRMESRLGGKGDMIQIIKALLGILTWKMED